MSPDRSFLDLMARLQAGEDAAARQLFERFRDRLMALARDRLSKRLAGKLDSEDVVQSVFKSFFVGHRAGEFKLESWNELWGLLTIITLRKCINRVEYFQAGRRAIEREVSLQAPGGPDASSLAVLDREPSPLEAAILTETIEQLLRGFDADDRQVIQLALQGYTIEEISAQLGRAERTVRRLRKRLEHRLTRLQAGDTGLPPLRERSGQ
jgi:RNA polymerase sigma-70 factor (ECF subfamily)